MGTTREEAIRTLYSAAMGTADWSQALGVLADFTHNRVVTLDTYDLEARTGSVLAANVAPDPAIEEYNREYGRANFQIEAGAPHYRPGKVLKASDFISQHKLLKSDLYHYVYKPMGIHYGGGLALEVSKDHMAEFTFVKPADAGDHTDRDIDRIRSLSAHLQQAWAGYQNLDRLQRSLDGLTEIWDNFLQS